MKPPPIQIEHLFISPEHNFFGHYGQPSGISGTSNCGRRPNGNWVGLYVGVLTFTVNTAIVKNVPRSWADLLKPDYKGQITFFAGEIYDQLCAEFSIWDRPPSVFRRNVITRGVDLPKLIGTEFEMQGVRFVGIGESAPCEWMNFAFAPGAEERLKGNGGLRAKILSDGVLRVEH